MRGPGQSVHVPAATAGGLPVTLRSAGDVRDLQFEIQYDPALLDIRAVGSGSDLPAGATLDVDLSVAGLVRVSIANATALAAGSLKLLTLTAMVPFDAPAQARQVLDIRNVVINGNAAPGADDDALQVVSYLGDANGNNVYDIEDVQLIQRTAIRFNTGFAAWDDISPLIVADIDGNGVITTIDASRVYQELSGNNSNLIPDIPSASALQQAAALRSVQPALSPAPATTNAQAHGGSTNGPRTGGNIAGTAGATGGSQAAASSGPYSPAVRFNSGLLDFGIGAPVNSNRWLVSWVGGSSKPGSNDWKVILP